MGCRGCINFHPEHSDCEYSWATIENPDTEGTPHCYKDEKEFFPQYSPNNNPTPLYSERITHERKRNRNN